MTFTNTLTNLYKDTEHTQIHGISAFDEHGCPCIGFRREHSGTPFTDPVIGGVSFMLCADAYYKDNYMPINDFNELIHVPVENVVINLRAQSGTFPICTINLGSFKVNSMRVHESKSIYPSFAFFDISRIH